jgi:hypothetical protein
MIQKINSDPGSALMQTLTSPVVYDEHEMELMDFMVGESANRKRDYK